MHKILGVSGMDNDADGEQIDVEDNKDFLDSYK